MPSAAPQPVLRGGEAARQREGGGGGPTAEPLTDGLVQNGDHGHSLDGPECHQPGRGRSGQGAVGSLGDVDRQPCRESAEPRTKPKDAPGEAPKEAPIAPTCRRFLLWGCVS